MGLMMNQDSEGVKNNLERKQRVLFAALSGFVAGTVAALLSSFINTWLFPDLPLYIEWSSMFLGWVLWSVLGGVLAGVAAFSSEGWKSILFSALGMAVTILVLNVLQNSESALLNTIVLLGLSLPFTAMMIPLAFLFFWLARRFLEAMSLRGWVRSRIFLVNFIVILALGVIPGVYTKMNTRAERGVRIMHEMLQTAAQASPQDAVPKALLKTNGFADHKDQPYTLSQVSSVSSTEGVDVTAHYNDGYTILCTVVLYPGSDPSIFSCKGQPP
jgi:hypothetical protein